jgi:hypothetical protein
MARFNISYYTSKSQILHEKVDFPSDDFLISILLDDGRHFEVETFSLMGKLDAIRVHMEDGFIHHIPIK